MLQPHDVVLIVGKRGSGKSHWYRTHVLPHERRVLTWDPHGEHPGDVRLTPDQLVDRLPELASGNPIRWAITPSSRWPKPCADEFTELVRILDEAPAGRYVLAIDEVGIIGERAGEALAHVATQSRHFGEQAGQGGVPLVFLAQRAVQIPKTAREQASQVVTFRQDNAADVDALSERIGEQLAAKVWTLNRERHECIHWREDAASGANARKGIPS